MARNFYRWGTGLLLALAGGYLALSFTLGCCPMCSLAEYLTPIAASSQRPVQSTLAQGHMAPTWRLTGMDGNTHASSSPSVGKVRIVTFWAPWCESCQSEVATLRNIKDQYGDTVSICGITLDVSSPAELATLAKKHRINYPLLLADDDTVEAFGGIAAIPTTFVIGADDRILSKLRGRSPSAQLERLVEDAISSAYRVANEPQSASLRAVVKMPL